MNALRIASGLPVFTDKARLMRQGVLPSDYMMLPLEVPGTSTVLPRIEQLLNVFRELQKQQGRKKTR